MADQQFKIGIQTTADTAGAREAERALDKVADESKRAEREFEGLQSGARAANQELGRTANTSEGVASKLGGRLTGNIQQAGFQIQDFAVQVGGGTSAMTAFGQQAPQFLGIFGPAGAIAGAIVSIGAVAFNVFSKMGNDGRSAAEKLEELNDVIEKIAKNKTADLNQEFADTAAALDLANRRATALKTGLDEVVKSENKLALAQLDRRALDRESTTAEANRKATAAGKPADTARVADDAALRIEERAAELARQGAEAEVMKVAAAQAEAQMAGGKLAAAEAARQKAIELLAVDRERLEVLRKQRDFLEKFAGGGGYLNDRPEGIPGFEEAIKKELETPQPASLFITELRKVAKTLAQSSDIQTPIKVAEAAIADLEPKLAGDNAELNKNVANLDVEYLAVRTKVANLVQAAKNNNESINLDLGAVNQGQQGNRDAAAKAGVKGGESAVVGQLEGLLSGIGESGGKDLAPFITELKNTLQDKALSADELARLPVLLSQYFGKIANLGQAQNEAVRAAMSRVDELERDVRNLKSTAAQRNP